MSRTRPHPRRASLHSRLLATVTLLGAAGLAQPGTAVAKPAPPRPAVTHVTLTFVDPSRPTDDPSGARSAPSRTLVTEVWMPTRHGRFPLIVFAHGSSGHPLKLTQMLSAWAEAGFVVAAPAFPLTNDRSGGPSIIADFVNQPKDVSFVITSMLHADRDRRSPVHAKVRRNRIGAAGHSLGGATLYGLTTSTCCRDPRLDAVVFMDAIRLPFPGDAAPAPPVHGPVLFIHIEGDPVVPYAGTRQQYEVATPPKYLMTLTQGIHSEPYEDIPSPHDAAVIAATSRFWDAYLAHDPKARREIVAAGTEAGLSSVEAVRR